VRGSTTPGHLISFDKKSDVVVEKIRRYSMRIADGAIDRLVHNWSKFGCRRVGSLEVCPLAAHNS
jgi:hypothetical protein